MPRWQDIENQMGQAGQQIQQAGQNFVNQNIDQPAAAKLAALQAASANAGGQMMGAPAGSPPMPPMPMNPSGAAPGMGGGAAGSTGPTAGTIDDMAAQRQKLLDMYNGASAETAAANMPPQQMAGYTQVPTEAQKWAMQQQPKHFQKLQQKVVQGHPINKHDIRESLHGAQEVTPELEAKLYPKQDDEDESNGSQSVQTARNP